MARAFQTQSRRLLSYALLPRARAALGLALSRMSRPRHARQASSCVHEGVRTCRRHASAARRRPRMHAAAGCSGYQVPGHSARYAWQRSRRTWNIYTEGSCFNSTILYIAFKVQRCDSQDILHPVSEPLGLKPRAEAATQICLSDTNRGRCEPSGSTFCCYTSIKTCQLGIARGFRACRAAWHRL